MVLDYSIDSQPDMVTRMVLLGRPLPSAPLLTRTQVFHGAEERRIPGNTLAVQPDKPYQVGGGWGRGRGRGVEAGPREREL